MKLSGGSYRFSGFCTLKSAQTQGSPYDEIPNVNGEVPKFNTKDQNINGDAKTQQWETRLQPKSRQQS